MKRQLFVLVVFYITICNVNCQRPSSPPARIKEYHDQCLQELGINAASFDKRNPTKEQMCFFKCMGQKEGFLDADGNYIKAYADKLRQPPEVKAKLEECMKITANDKCEQIYKQFSCGMKAFRPPNN